MMEPQQVTRWRCPRCLGLFSTRNDAVIHMRACGKPASWKARTNPDVEERITDR